MLKKALRDPLPCVCPDVPPPEKAHQGVGTDATVFSTRQEIEGLRPRSISREPKSSSEVVLKPAAGTHEIAGPVDDVESGCRYAKGASD